MASRPAGAATTAGVAVGVAEGVVAAFAGTLDAMAAPAAASEPARTSVLLIRLTGDIDVEHDASHANGLCAFPRVYLAVTN